MRGRGATARAALTATALPEHPSRRIVRSSLGGVPFPPGARPTVRRTRPGQAARGRSAALTAAPPGPAVATSATGTPKKSVCATIA